MYRTIEEIDTKSIESDFFKEYLSFKDDDSILLFQIGEFFETFLSDAKVVSDITGISLGARSVKGIGKVLQAGIPKKVLNFYIKKIINENYKVSVCVQNENKNSEFSHEIIRKYTKGTIFEDEFLEAYENNYILSLANDNNIFNISYADSSTGEFYKTSGSIEQIMQEIIKISPNEILIKSSDKEKFQKLILNYNCTILDSKYNSISDVSDILLKYCKDTQKKYSAKFEKITEYELNSYMVIDEISRRNLELTRMRSNFKKKGSLFWFLNNTKTPMGTRLLKNFISEPLTNINKILERENAVFELIQDSKLASKLSKVLENFSDIQRMSSKVSNSTILPKGLFELAQNSLSINELFEMTKNFKSPLLKIEKAKVSKLSSFISEIFDALDENSSNDIKQGNIILDGYNSNLDYLREELDEVKNEINKYVNDEVKKLKIEKYIFNYSRQIGYYLEISQNKEKLLSSEYIKKQALSNSSRYTTKKIMDFEQKIFNLNYKINELEYELYSNLKSKASSYVDLIRNIAKDIAYIDVFNSFAICAINYNLVIPKYSKKGINIKDGFHPSLVKSVNKITKNDTELDDGSIIILTGANMSGKSTYLKQNALISVLFQIGAFVPAGSAELTITDKIFFRQSAIDNILNNDSSFMVEMNDFKYILDNATKSSFVLLDEPAKSTNENEGGAITKAFLKYIIKHLNVKAIIATHNIALTKLEELYPAKVKNYVVGINNDSDIVDRKIKRGVVNSSLAINTAKKANLPDEIIQDALKYMNR